MANASGQQYGVGLKYAAIFALNSDQRPAATNTTAYMGVAFQGKRTFSFNVPEARRIDHFDGDNIDAVDYLSPNEAVTGELLAHGIDFTMDAAVSGLSTFNVGEMTMLVGGSDKDGEEPEVGLMLYQQALDKSGKTRHWVFVVFPRVKIHALPGGMDENPSETRYTFIANPVEKHLWGTTMSTSTEGASKASFTRGTAKYKPAIASFVGDGSTLVFAFPAAQQAYSTDKIAVFVDGVLTTTGITKAVTGVTFTTAPALNADVNIVYEWE